MACMTTFKNVLDVCASSPSCPRIRDIRSHFLCDFHRLATTVKQFFHEEASEVFEGNHVGEGSDVGLEGGLRS